MTGLTAQVNRLLGLCKILCQCELRVQATRGKVALEPLLCKRFNS